MSRSNIRIVDQITGQYLIEWRNSLWQSIRHKEVLIWSFMAFYVVAVGFAMTSSDLLRLGRIAPFLGVLILSVLGAHVVLDAIKWAARNIYTITRIERIFIGDQVGVLIPRSFTSPTFRVSTVHRVQMLVIVMTVVGSYGVYVIPFFDWEGATTLERGWPLLGFLLVGATEVGFFWRLHADSRSERDSYFAFRSEFERTPDGSTVPAIDQAEKDAASLDDPSNLGCGVGAASSMCLFSMALLTNLGECGRVSAVWAVAVIGGVSMALILRRWLGRSGRGDLRTIKYLNVSLGAVSLFLSGVVLS